MTEVIYLLCAGTSMLCAVMLLRGYRSTRTRLLLYSSLCFAGLALSNVALVVDLVLLPTIDLSAVRGGFAVVSMAVLLYGLVLES